MVHGIYIKNRPKSKWQLFSVAASAEIANNDLSKALKQAISEGYENAEVAVQLFDSVFYIPESLPSIKEQKILYN